MNDFTHIVAGEPSPTRREAVKKKTAEYLMRAEQISSQHLRKDMGQGSTQTVVSGRKSVSGIHQSSFISMNPLQEMNEPPYVLIYTMTLIALLFLLSPGYHFTLLKLHFFLKAFGEQCCPSTSRGGPRSPSEELRSYRVLGIVDKVSLPSSATCSQILTIN